ncbi:AcrR family transcriptional regulator [Agrobacterium vitis]|nr:AcrR family transcriptional regulator [Agrobacterium vitis]MBE1436511.1 AcrR family transcriptional regulator [Agrobacterium vitis]
MRKDAAQNRQRLIEAARKVMWERGHDVPLEMITEQAGITRGTLYRNFADRSELYRAVLDYEVALIKDQLDTTDSCGLFFVMRKLIEVSDLYHAFASSLQNNSSDPTQACSPAALLNDVLAKPLAVAKAEGIVRQTLSEEEVLLACRMVSYGWRLDGEPDRATAIDKRLLLMIRGLAANPNIGPEK